MDALPQSIAIAGAWGYIGRKLLDAALALEISPYVFDPGPAPDDLDLDAVTLVGDEEEFYHLDADLFHLALHPEHRQKGLDMLLARAGDEPVLILNEKPMARPERPEECRAVIKAVENSTAVMLYDFLELFDPITHAITRYLSGFDQVEIADIHLHRAKDRESPDNPRNYKQIVHIQYQESVHCLAFVLHLLASLKGDLPGVFSKGLSAVARSQPYSPPNPQDYPYVVDGQCHYRISLGEANIEGRNDFKSGAPFTKKKVIRGLAEGRPFTIETNHLEGHKYLYIDGVDQGFRADASTYEHIISTLWRWYRHLEVRQLMRGVYPNPTLAHLTYQLSGVLWKSCWTGEAIELSSFDELVSFDAGFAEAVSSFARYDCTPEEER